MKIYLVGGAVRDKLLKLPVKENDWVVVGATPEHMLNLGYKPVGKDFPVFLHPNTHEEYALARTERKIKPGYTGFQFHAHPTVTLEEDLRRRDLTINAIAMDEQNNIIDPYGGKIDLDNRILRHVSDAFSEDPVRILRLARFYARFAHLGFSIANETVVLMRHMVKNGEVNALVAERVWQELEKALSEPNPEKFFEALRMCGALKVLFPELDCLFGVPCSPKWHPEIDTGIHTLMVLQQAVLLSNDSSVRFAALVHDLGKGTTPKNEWPKHSGHEERSVALIKNLTARLRVPKIYTDLALIVAQYHGDIHNALELRANTVVKILEQIDAFRRPERFQNFLLACEADFRGRPSFENQPYDQSKFFYDSYLAAKNIDIQGIVKVESEKTKIAEKIHQLRIAAVKKISGSC